MGAARRDERVQCHWLLVKKPLSGCLVGVSEVPNLVVFFFGVALNIVRLECRDTCGRLKPHIGRQRCGQRSAVGGHGRWSVSGGFRCRTAPFGSSSLCLAAPRSGGFTSGFVSLPERQRSSTEHVACGCPTGRLAQRTCCRCGVMGRPAVGEPPSWDPAMLPQDGANYQ